MNQSICPSDGSVNVLADSAKGSLTNHYGDRALLTTGTKIKVS